MDFELYQNVSRLDLDTLKVGDQVKVNDWEDAMTVKAVSENYLVMTCQKDGDVYYSVCSKLPWHGIRHNAMRGGMFHCSTDDWVWGSPLCIEHKDVYKFEDPELSAQYLQDFEDGKCHLSERCGIPIYDLYVRRGSSSG